MYKERYPKYKEAIIKTIAQIRRDDDDRRMYGDAYPDLTPEEIFEWWTSKKGIKQWIAENKLQQKLNL